MNASMKSLELYYAQKDGCKLHGDGHGKICVECVNDALTEAYKAGSEASKWIPVEHELLVALDKGTWEALGAWAEKYGIGEALPNKWKEAKAYAIEWVLALPSPPKPSKDGQNS